MHNTSVRYLVLVLVTASALYGASYQQFRFFDIRDSRGVGDAPSYIAMSQGNYDVDPVGRYRPLVPMLASLIRTPLSRLTSNEAELVKLEFYVVNFVITLTTSLLLFGTLARLGFDWRLCFLGEMFFIASRITVISAATPMVDSLYFFSVGMIVHLMLLGRSVPLAFTMPALVLSKETVIPFLLLPLASKSTRSWAIVGSIMFSLVVFFILRRHIDHGSEATSLAAIVADHVHQNVLPSLVRLSSPSGIHDLFNGFGFLAIIAPLGLLVDRRQRKYKLPSFLFIPVPIALALALVSGNLGRMFFAAYVPMIACSLVFIERCFTAAEIAQAPRPSGK